MRTSDGSREIPAGGSVKRECITVNSAVFAPSPSPSTSTMVTVDSGVRPK
jgi:hypothetical protein